MEISVRILYNKVIYPLRRLFPRRRQLPAAKGFAANKGVKNLAESEYVIEMLNITKEFPGIRANDNITLQLKRGEIHALLGEKRCRQVDADERALWALSAGERRH